MATTEELALDARVQTLEKVVATLVDAHGTGALDEQTRAELKARLAPAPLAADSAESAPTDGAESTDSSATEQTSSSSSDEQGNEDAASGDGSASA